MSRCVSTTQHAEQFAPWSSQSAVFVGQATRQTTTNRATAWTLVLLRNVMTWRTLHGCRSGWHVRAGDCIWMSAVGGSGRRPVILRARMMGTIEASVYESESLFYKDQQNVEGAHLHASPDVQTLHLKVYGCFAHRAGTGVSCTPMLSLCDATICVVASDFFVPFLARRPTVGHQPLLINLGRTRCDVEEKFKRVVGIETLQLEFTGGWNRTRRRFLKRRCPDCDPALL